jgi:hypothetical protein
MFANLDTLVQARKRKDADRSAARRAYLTWRVKEHIELTEALAEDLEVELAQFATNMRGLH